jgi:hypothetical protein
MFPVLSVKWKPFYFTQGYMVLLQKARRIAVNICIPCRQGGITLLISGKNTSSFQGDQRFWRLVCSGQLESNRNSRRQTNTVLLHGHQ